MKPLDCQKLYRNVDLYDAQHIDFDDDLSFYLKQAKNYGDPILELACGSGRITLPLAEDNHDIVGLDVSPTMLSRARQKAKDMDLNIDWVEADCRDFNLGRRFRFIFIPFNSFLHIHDRESFEACFDCVRKHLEPDGRFLIDIYNPSLEILNRDSSKRYPVMHQGGADQTDLVEITENNVYDPATQINRVKWYIKVTGVGEEIVEELTHRIYFPQEIDSLIVYNNFEIDVKYGDFDESEFTSDSPKQLIVCHRR